MKLVITVLGKDRVGIIARISAVLADNSVNILDISQTILQGYFNMIMLAESPESGIPIARLAEFLDAAGEDLGVQVRVQHEDIFTAMHRV
jgi:ACT domain-containing protein